MKINYQLEMERALTRIRAAGERPRLLLHSCCAPCSSAVLERLTPDFDIVIYYYDPNIEPFGEFETRARELEKLIGQMPHAGRIEMIRGPWDNEAFHERVRGLEREPEGGLRCEQCFRMRLEASAAKADELGCGWVTTTLTISPLKDARKLNAIGQACAEGRRAQWLCSDFKKKDGYRRSCALSAQYGLYRQDYCGCVYSRLERDRRERQRQRELST